MPLLILIADDDPGIRLALSEYLELSGYSVIAAENGEEALHLLETYYPHLLVSDIKMPGKNGYELIKEVRQRPEFRLLPVVFLTEKSNTEERVRGYQTGCDIYLSKPFEMEELAAVVRNLLERSQIMQSELIFSKREINPKLQKPAELPDVQTVTNNLFNFTEREQEVLALLAKGLSNLEIGNKLHLSHRTIEKYVSSLLKKTETSNRSELVRFALDHHLVS